MNSLLEQLKKRRIELGFKQHDMMMRAGISRQQYQRLESKGNPRLDTLKLIAKGLNSELMLIPREKMSAVKAILTAGKALSDRPNDVNDKNVGVSDLPENELANEPWKDLLKSEE